MKTLLTITFILIATTSFANCRDDRKSFRKAQEYGAYDFVCKDEYDGRTTSSWRMSSEDFKKYREALKQSKSRSKK